MPRLSVTALRWLLLVVNAGVLGGVVFLGQDLVRNASDGHLRQEMPNPAEFVVPEDREQVFNASQQRNLTNIHKRKKPKPPAPPPPRQTQELPAAQGGPLKEWEIAYVVIDGDERAAEIREKTAQATVTRPTTTRGRPSRTRSNRRTSRNRSTATRRTAATQQGRHRYVREGGIFRVDDVEFTVVKIQFQPSEMLEYRPVGAGGRAYQISRERPELTGVELDSHGKITTLVGLGPDELNPDPNAAPTAEPANKDQESSIRSTNRAQGGRETSAKKPQPAGRTQAGDARAKREAAAKARQDADKVKKELEKAAHRLF